MTIKVKVELDEAMVKKLQDLVKQTIIEYGGIATTQTLNVTPWRRWDDK